MLSSFFRELGQLADDIGAAVKTREFWVYFALLGALLGLMIGLAYLASGFDALTREQALLAIACNAGDRQLLTIIVGGMVFVILSFFTLGEVVLWFENARRARTHRWTNRASKFRPVAFVVGALGLGLTGFYVLSSWCH